MPLALASLVLILDNPFPWDRAMVSTHLAHREQRMTATAVYWGREESMEKRVIDSEDDEVEEPLLKEDLPMLSF
ncbi:MAG: hypothetical protein M1818_003563 [Claussenomyces sp. TS43310]|nr:MAG: hypothetical protein M1818_003563 [Claussenomyces sp. TS43310]